MVLSYLLKAPQRALLLITLLASPAVWADESYSNIFIFGDSLSDTGNLASIAGDFPNPPFFNNRMSNGPVALEVVASTLNLKADASLYLLGLSAGSNYAVVGARAAGDQAIDLSFQVAAFLANYNGSAPADALYVMLIGANDVFEATSNPDRQLANQIIDNGVMAEARQIQTLIDAGAEQILIINVPDVSITPLMKLTAAAIQNPDLIDYANNLTKRYNKKLKSTLEELHHVNDMDIELYNLFKTSLNLLKEAHDLGITNTTDACFSTATLTFNEGCNFGANFDRYYFFDEVHPTAKAHQYFGELIAKEIN